MKDFKENDLLQVMDVNETMNVNGGWDFEHAVMGAASVCLLGPEASLLAFAVCGFF